MKRNVCTSFILLIMLGIGCGPAKKPRSRISALSIKNPAWKQGAIEIPDTTQSAPAPLTKKTCHIFIFIHGATTFIPSVSAFRHAWQQSSNNKTSESFYQHYQNKIRFGGYRKNQPIGIKGLWAINPHQKRTRTQKTIHSSETYPIIRLYETAHKHVIGAKTERLLFYTFGWDGSLSHICRQRWAHVLYRSLIKLREKIHQQLPGSPIKITILGHSHGGNVALNLAPFEKKYGSKLVVDELILMGTPIQSETRHLAEHSLFKKVFNLYSTGDWVQKMDCISTRDFFSRRTFGTRKKHKPRALPCNIIDLEIRVGSYQPAHAEFWFLGGILHFFYRNNFPLYPYPILTFVPLILELLSYNNDHSCNLKLSMDRVGNEYFFSLFDKQFHRSLPERFWARVDLPPHPQRAIHH